jgi:MFS family permease
MSRRGGSVRAVSERVEAAVPRRVTASITLGTLLNPLNSSMIAVALVALQGAFDVGVATSSWLVSAFYLAACVAQPLMGRIADRFGPRRVYLAGLALTCATGVVAMLAPGFGALVACRVVQAVGTSAAFPAGLALIRRLAGGRPPAAALATISVANGTSAALGPLLGGLLVTVAGWRGIFAVNVPLAAVGFVLALRWLPADPAPPRGAAEPGERSVLAQLDLPGVALFSATVVGLLGFLLSLGASPQWWLLPVVPAAGALLAWWELRVATPFLDLRMLGRHLRLVRALVQQVGVQAVYYAMFYGLPLWLQRVRGLPAHTVGLLMLPVAALGIALTPAAAVMLRRSGPRPLLLLGGGGLVLGSLAMLTIGDATPLAVIVVAGSILGLPQAFNNLALQASVYAEAPRGHTGVAAGLFQTGRYLGAIMSTALLGLVFERGVTSDGLHAVAYAMVALAAVLAAVAYRAGHTGAHRRPPPTVWTRWRGPGGRHEPSGYRRDSQADAGGSGR